MQILSRVRVVHRCSTPRDFCYGVSILKRYLRGATAINVVANTYLTARDELVVVHTNYHGRICGEVFNFRSSKYMRNARVKRSAFRVVDIYNLVCDNDSRFIAI